MIRIYEKKKLSWYTANKKNLSRPFLCITSKLSLAVVTSLQHLCIFVCQEFPPAGRSSQRLTNKESRDGLVLFVCQSPPACSRLLCLMSDGEGAAGKALQGPAIKQKLILTSTARGEAAVARGEIVPNLPHSSSDIRQWHWGLDNTLRAALMYMHRHPLPPPHPPLLSANELSPAQEPIGSVDLCRRCRGAGEKRLCQSRTLWGKAALKFIPSWSASLNTDKSTGPVLQC